MAAGATYEPIATQTLSSAAASVTFSSISGSYTDLVIVGNFGTANGNCPLMQFNSDTGSNYSITELVGNGTSATSSRRSSATSIDISKTVGGNGNLQQNFVISIQNYSNSTTYKTALVRHNMATGTYPGVTAIVGLWRSTSAITTIKLLTDGGNYNSGSTFTLYGIAAA